MERRKKISFLILFFVFSMIGIISGGVAFLNLHYFLEIQNVEMEECKVIGYKECITNGDVISYILHLQINNCTALYEKFDISISSTIDVGGCSEYWNHNNMTYIPCRVKDCDIILASPSLYITIFSVLFVLSICCTFVSIICIIMRCRNGTYYPYQTIFSKHYPYY